MVAEQEDILEELHTLPAEKLREVVARASVLLGADGRSGRDKDDPDLTFFHSVFSDVLKEQANAPCPPLTVLRKTRAWPSFKAGSAEVLAYVAEAFDPRGRAETVKALRLVLGLMAAELKGRGIPASLLPMSQRLVRVGDCVDRSFPGYRESGLLSVVLRRKVERQ